MAASLVTVCVVLSGLAASPDEDFERSVQPFLDKHCVRCHGEQEQKGRFRLDELSRDFTGESAVDPWLEVVEKLNTGEMPPADEPERPDAEDSGRVASWLAARIEEGSAARLARRDAVSFHRLTRTEYANTIHDLLGVRFDADDPGGLNADDRWRGFERIGAVLSTSASHVEKYLAAAELVLAEAYPETPPECRVARYSAVDLAGGAGADVERRDEIRVDLWPGQLVRVAPPGGRIEHPGVYRVRIQVSGLRPRGDRPPHLTVYAETLDRLLFERDVDATERAPLVLELEAHLPVGNHELTLTNGVPGPAILTRLTRSESRPFFSLAEGRIPWQVQLKEDDDTPVFPLLVVDWVEWEGPLATATRPHPLPAAGGGTEQLRESLRAFAERAFRRPPLPAEIDRYVQLVESEVAEGAEWTAAVKTGLLAILCSKDFLYLTEGSVDGERAGLTDWELASRLSYFLWSTMPDERLFDLARAGTLRERDVLRSEVARMLADQRARRFVESFARQWLQLDRVGMFTPDKELYPDYDEHLERSMVRETTAFFGEVLSRDLSLRELLDSDWTMLNPRLALHYGLAGVEQDRFRRVSLGADSQRGGILTHAAVLSLTSDGTRHRPVHRGAWLSEAILGEIPPPPPANVDPIEPNPGDAEKATVREQLGSHVADPNCAACHRKIDPLGFAFDNYDAIGRWRTEELVPTGRGANPAVDASGVLPDGRTFAGPGELRQLLVDDIDRFHAAFIEKLATYALRRTMSVDDRDELASIAAASAANDYRLAHLVEVLILSDLFQGR